MNKNVYGKMARDNIRKSKKLYFPYLFTIIGSIMFFYILSSISSNTYIYDPVTKIETFKGAQLLCKVLKTGTFTTAIFAVIFLFYANSFILKHQKKQMGLYRVLGMERRHMLRLLASEVLYLYGTGLLCGMMLGILFDKLMLVFLVKIVGQTAPSGFYISQIAVKNSVILTLVIALLLLLHSVISILTTKDIELLKSTQSGEKEPKNRLVLAFGGMIILIAGYSLALKANNVSDGISNFFPAAFMVIVATYILFTAGSIAVLKFLKKRKNFYYTTRHFISISGLLYRMKQNAAGLATICILSTSAIIVLAAGASLYANGERSINEMFPHEILIKTNELSLAETNETVETVLKRHQLTAEETISVAYGTSLFIVTETGLSSDIENNFTDWSLVPDFFVLTLEEYNRIYETNETLGENEVLLYVTNEIYTKDTLEYDGTTYQVKGSAKSDCLEYIQDSSMALFSKMLLVVPDQSVFDRFVNNIKDPTITPGKVNYVAFNLNASNDKIQEFITDLTGSFACTISYKQDEQDEFYSMYGGILFIGIVLGLLFIMSTVMMIYYKQISEGYEDKERFLIMQKVGLSKPEIKKTIRSQILLVFFLPLVTAIIHTSFALKIISKCLGLVVLVHMPTFITSFIITCLIFSVIYVMVYLFTSKEYYNIVNE